MPSAGGGFEQAYNAQAGVDVETHLIVEQHITQHPNDKQEIEPALAALEKLPVALGKVKKLLADTGYFSAANVEKCIEDGHRGIGVWHCQRCAGVPAVSVARPGCRARRMESGLYRMEFEENACSECVNRGCEHFSLQNDAI